MKMRVRAVPRGSAQSPKLNAVPTRACATPRLTPPILTDAASPSLTPSADDRRPPCWPFTPSAVLSWHACLPIAPESGRMQPAAGTRRLNRCAGVPIRGEEYIGTAAGTGPVGAGPLRAARPGSETGMRSALGLHRKWRSEHGGESARLAPANWPGRPRIPHPRLGLLYCQSYSQRPDTRQH